MLSELVMNFTSRCHHEDDVWARNSLLGVADALWLRIMQVSPSFAFKICEVSLGLTNSKKIKLEERNLLTR